MNRLQEMLILSRDSPRRDVEHQALAGDSDDIVEPNHHETEAHESLMARALRLGRTHRKIFAAAAALMVFWGAAMLLMSPRGEVTPENGMMGHGDGPSFTTLTFKAGAILSVSGVAEVFGRSQRLTAVIVEYDRLISSAGLSSSAWSVEGFQITAVYTTTSRAIAAEEDKVQDGKFVVLKLDSETGAAIIYAPNIDVQEVSVVVTQTGTVQAADGTRIAPITTSVVNSQLQNLVVDDFQQRNFLDSATGLMLRYNLFIPSTNQDEAGSLPLVLFMHDAGVTGSNPLRTLQQGLGAISFASPSDQKKHPAFVLAPQYPVTLANDGSELNDYGKLTIRLIESLKKEFVAIDSDRIYTTGQSGGCMASIALNIAHPNYFAASLLVAGQWNASKVANMASARLWIVVSEDDAKAYPGMQEIVTVLEANGADITEAQWNGRADQSELNAAVTAQIEAGVDSNVRFSHFQKGTVVPEGEGNEGASGHVWTWPIAYDIPALRDWLLSQSRSLYN